MIILRTNLSLKWRQINKTHGWHLALDMRVQSEIPLPSDGFFFDLLEQWDVRALSIRKTADLPLQLWAGTFPCFVAIRFYFLFIHNHLTLRKWCYTRLQHDLPLDPIISPYHFHFQTFVTWLRENMGDDLHIWSYICTLSKMSWKALSKARG